MKKTIDWEKVWNDLEEWITEREDQPACRNCGSREHRFPDWKEHQEKIKELVDTQVREMVLSTRLNNVKNKTET